ncbi:MAG TPA: outer membrane beta-barrel protein [Candidatus Acidoferrum sp.]|nr:outer membrane beta-barrel protein [Candidatus Acidoferrum sp.]
MAWRRVLFFVFLFSIAGVSNAWAQHQIELTPFGGARFGGVIDVNTTDVDYLPIKSSWNYGVMADYTVWPQFQAEFMFNHQPTDLDQHVIATDSRQFLTSADIDMYQWGFLFALKPPEARLQPFIVGGLGFTHFKAGGDLPFTNRFSYNLGLGAKYFFNRHVGLRAEARWSPSRTTTQQGTFCDPFFGCEIVPVASHAEQGQANIGLIFRFR